MTENTIGKYLAKKTGKKEIPAVYFRSIDTDKILAESPATQDPANEAAAKKKLMFDYSDLLPTNTNTNNLERTRLDGRSEETPIKLNTTQIKQTDLIKKHSTQNQSIFSMFLKQKLAQEKQKQVSILVQQKKNQGPKVTFSEKIVFINDEDPKQSQSKVPRFFRPPVLKQILNNKTNQNAHYEKPQHQIKQTQPKFVKETGSVKQESIKINQGKIMEIEKPVKIQQPIHITSYELPAFSLPAPTNKINSSMYEKFGRALIIYGEQQMIKNYGTSNPTITFASELEEQQMEKNMNLIMECIEPCYQKLLQQNIQIISLCKQQKREYEIDEKLHFKLQQLQSMLIADVLDQQRQILHMETQNQQLEQTIQKLRVQFYELPEASKSENKQKLSKSISEIITKVEDISLNEKQGQQEKFFLNSLQTELFYVNLIIDAAASVISKLSRIFEP